MGVDTSSLEGVDIRQTYKEDLKRRGAKYKALDDDFYEKYTQDTYDKGELRDIEQTMLDLDRAEGDLTAKTQEKQVQERSDARQRLRAKKPTSRVITPRTSSLLTGPINSSATSGTAAAAPLGALSKLGV